MSNSRGSQSGEGPGPSIKTSLSSTKPVFPSTVHFTPFSLEIDHSKHHSTYKHTPLPLIGEHSLHQKTNKVKINKTSLIEPDKINYFAIDTINHIGAAEIWGARKTQEDRILFGALDPRTANLTETSWHQAFKATIYEMEKCVEDKDFPGNSGETGSCVCIASIIGSTIHIANLGDSTALLFIIDKDNQPQVTLLHSLHRPTEAAEIIRLRETNGFITGQRLGGLLAISRGIGDTFYHRSGFSHEPEIKTHVATIPSTNKAFLVIACDGVTESTTLETLGRVVANNKDQSPDEIAVAICMQAINDNSQDNNSAIVIPIDPQNPKPLFGMVLDGHGGDSVSEFLYQHIGEELNKQLLIALDNELKTSTTKNLMPASSPSMLNGLFSQTSSSAKEEKKKKSGKSLKK